MKNPMPRLHRILLLALFSCVTVSGVTAQSEQSAPRLDAGTTLHVLIDNARSELTIDQYSYLGGAIREAFKEHGYNGEISVKRWAANAESGEQSLLLRIVRWEESMPGEVECRLYAVARIGETEKNLGVVVGKKSGIVNLSNSLIEIYREAALNAASKLVDKLVEENLLRASKKARAGESSGG